MTVTATVVLDRLNCFLESDQRGQGHSEPYIWPYLGVLNGGQFYSIPTNASLPDARRIIVHEITANQSASIPLLSNSQFTATFDDSQTIRHFFLVVALWEADDFPAESMRAGYQAYLDALHNQFMDNLSRLSQASEAERLQIIEEIKGAVASRVTQAIKATLSTWQGLTLNRDDYIAADFRNYDVTAPALFTLEFKGVSGDPLVIPRFWLGGIAYDTREFPVRYSLDGRLDIVISHPTHGPLDSNLVTPVVG